MHSFSSMRCILPFLFIQTKKLRTFLYVRGLECKGCAEKDDFVKMAFENRNVPLTSAKTSDSTESTESEADKKKSVDDV